MITINTIDADEFYTAIRITSPTDIDFSQDMLLTCCGDTEKIARAEAISYVESLYYELKNFLSDEGIDLTNE